MKKTVLAFVLAAFALSACNTFQGMGRDIEGAGEALSGSAAKTKEKMTK
jgi:entericidin B